MMSVSPLMLQDLFFQRIVQCIPKDLYTHSASSGESGAADDEQEKYHNHRKLPLTVEERKSKSKSVIKDKYQQLQLTQSSTVTTISECFCGHQLNSATHLELKSTAEAFCSPVSEPIQCTGAIEDLRTRLKRRISELKETRSSKPANPHRPVTAKTKPPKKHEHILTSMETVTTSTAHEPSATSSAVPFDENSEDIYLSKLLVVNKTVEPSIRNSAITLEEQSVKSRIGGGKKRRLEVLLKEAEKKRNRMEKLKAEHRSETLQNTGDLPEAISAGKKLQQELWNDALKTASGEKTISVSDSAKIRKALKKKEKSKLKSAERWTARIASVEETKAERIQKRTDNINNRNRKHSFTTQYTSTTGNTSKKPAPKIPPRAGFEGRTNTGKFLNNKRKNE